MTGDPLKAAMDRHNMIVKDIVSMIEVYKMGEGEVAAIFLAFAAKNALNGGVDHKTFMQWAKEAWTSETFKELEIAMKLQTEATVKHIKNNGLFKT